MKKPYIYFLTTLVAVLLLAGAAKADITEIGLIGSTDTMTFLNNGTNTVISSFSGAGNTLSGNQSGFVQPGALQGNYTFTLTGTPVLTLTGTAGGVSVYSVKGGSIAFSFTQTSGGNGQLSGTILLSTLTLTDGVSNPSFSGSLQVTSSSGLSGTNSFASYWPVGGDANIDFTLNALTGASSIDAVYTGGEGASASASISSGEVNPVVVPEPASIALLGSGLLVAGGLVKKRRRK